MSLIWIILVSFNSPSFNSSIWLKNHHQGDLVPLFCFTFFHLFFSFMYHHHHLHFFLPFSLALKLGLISHWSQTIRPSTSWRSAKSEEGKYLSHVDRGWERQGNRTWSSFLFFLLLILIYVNYVYYLNLSPTDFLCGRRKKAKIHGTWNNPAIDNFSFPSSSFLFLFSSSLHFTLPHLFLLIIKIYHYIKFILDYIISSFHVYVTFLIFYVLSKGRDSSKYHQVIIIREKRLRMKKKKIFTLYVIHFFFLFKLILIYIHDDCGLEIINQHFAQFYREICSIFLVVV